MPGPVYFVGPLPPPVHGFSTICAAVHGLLSTRVGVRLCNRAPGARLRSVADAAAFVGRLVFGQRGALYLGLSGGRGQWIDLAFVAAARLRGRKIFFHHHSYAYVRESTASARCIFSIARGATHLVLSPNMGRDLAARYATDTAQFIALSNAAFMADAPTQAPPKPDVGPVLQLGYLSNITREKGILHFFDTLAELDRLCVAFEARIAGPLGEDVREEFERALARQPRATHLGPVYGEAKAAFLRGLDVLLFPTDYVNEAEPLVIHEALGASVYVISCPRGAIPEVLTAESGAVFPAAEFARGAAARLRDMHAQGTIAAARRQALERARTLKASAVGKLRAAIDAMVSA